MRCTQRPSAFAYTLRLPSYTLLGKQKGVFNASTVSTLPVLFFFHLSFSSRSLCWLRRFHYVYVCVCVQVFVYGSHVRLCVCVCLFFWDHCSTSMHNWRWANVGKKYKYIFVASLMITNTNEVFFSSFFIHSFLNFEWFSFQCNFYWIMRCWFGRIRRDKRSLY